MNGTELHDHLARVTADVGADRPSIRALRATADRSRTRSRRLAAGTAVVVVAGAGVGVAVVATGGRHVVRTAASPPASAGLPGLVARGSVTLPAALTPLQVERTGDLVWAVALNGSELEVLHGRVGHELTPVDLNGVDTTGSDVTIALTPSRAYVALSSGSSNTGRARVPYLDERDASTGADEVGWTLDDTQDPSHHNYDGDGAALVRTDDGAPVLAITSQTGGQQTVRFAVLDPTASPLRDLLSTEVTSAAAVPATALTVGARTPSFQGLDLVTTDHGVPTYAYLVGTRGTVPVVDLQTGEVSTYRSGFSLSESSGGLDARAVGAVGGRVVFDVEGDDHEDHAQIAAPSALMPEATGPAGGSVYVAAGRIYRERDTGVGADLDELSAATLRAAGPVAFMPDSGVLPTYGSYDVQAVGSGQRIAFYAAP